MVWAIPIPGVETLHSRRAIRDQRLPGSQTGDQRLLILTFNRENP